jgi:signal peptidase I
MTRRSIVRAAWLVFAVVLAGGWYLGLRPESLGGGTGYVTIRGTSMLPVYETGDLVLTRKQPSYSKGDIVAYRVPDGDLGEGIVVIHRIVGGNASDGFELLGDNNPEKDDWYPTDADVVGKAWVHVPKVGIVLSYLHSPAPLASLAAAVAVVFVAFPKRKSDDAKLAEPSGLLWTPISDGTSALTG